MKKVYALIFSFLLLVFPFFISATGAYAEGEDFLLHEGLPPLGANSPKCQPDSAHPEPIILVPGTFTSMTEDWSMLSPMLVNHGYCVYSLNYGFTLSGGYSTGPIESSAAELKDFVDHVLALTGAKKVSIIGHSQGGMMPRYYIKFLGGAEKVDDLIGLAPSNHGTKGLYGFSYLTHTASDLTQCAACMEQLTGSDFLNQLNQGNETSGKVSYTVIETRYDEVVVPYKSAFLDGSSPQVSNITLQNYYPLDFVDHIGIAYDLNAYPFIFDALSHDGPARY